MRNNKGTKSEFCPDVPNWGKFLPFLANSSVSICLILWRCSRASISFGSVWSSLMSRSSQEGRGGKLWKKSSAADGSSGPAGWKIRQQDGKIPMGKGQDCGKLGMIDGSYGFPKR